MIVLQDVDNLYVEASINESNISDIVLGQPIDVTYDAFGSDKHFAATVSSIDLSPTIEDGIVNYKIKALITDTTQIKSGMTANLSVLIASKPQVVVIPARMITSVDGQKTVEVLVNERRGSHVSRTVTVGLVGDGGLTEIVSGLASGERVVSFSK